MSTKFSPSSGTSFASGREQEPLPVSFIRKTKPAVFSRDLSYPVAHLENREFVVSCADLGQHVKGKKLPGARDDKARGWVIPATDAVAGLIVEIWASAGLRGTQEFRDYLSAAIWRHEKAHAALHAKSLPPIPITAVQPEGKWLHQRRAFWFAQPLDAALLAVTMGGGKTKIAIDLMMNWRARKTLIISPLTACEDAWVPQLDQYVVGSFILTECYGKSITQKMRLLDAFHDPSVDHSIVLINHESFWREPIRSMLAATEWDLIIADEIHREKSAGSKQSLFLFQLASKAHKRLGLTGTPMPHSPLDVYGQFRFLDRGIYGTNYAAFEQDHAVYGGYRLHEVIGYRNLESLNKKFYSIAIVVDDSEQGLPETVDIERHVEMDPEMRRLYNNVDEEFIAEVGKHSVTAANAGVKLLRLHQMACGILAMGEGKNVKTKRLSSEKIAATIDILENEVTEKEPVVIFTRFRPDTRDLYDHLTKKGFECAEVSGDRDELKMWKDGKARILIAQIQTVKEGVDLTRASIAIFYSTGISLGDYEQCRKRLHRPPQKRMVRFIHLLAKGTRDVSTMRSLQKRKDVVQEALREIKATA